MGKENTNDQYDHVVDETKDVDHSPSTSLRRETFDVVPQYNTPSLDDKQNVTPKSSATRKRSVYQSDAESSASSNLSKKSTYMTPACTPKRLSKIVFMDNGRSCQLNNYEGISVLTPIKTHLMETRLDLMLRSPGLSLRTRIVPRQETAQREPSTQQEMRPRFKNETFHHEDIVESEHEDSSGAASPNVPLCFVVEQKPHESVIAQNVVALHPSDGNKKQNPAMPKKVVRFMAVAEAVHHFQRDTPARFHSLPVRNTLQNKMHIRKANQCTGRRASTIPKSPFLATKMRQNSKLVEHISSHADKEQQELEEMKKYQFKAKPVKRSVLIPPRKDSIVSKTRTRIQPFNLSQGQRKEPTPEPVFCFKAQPLPRAILALPKGGLPPSQQLPVTEPCSSNLRITAKFPKRVKVAIPGNKTKDVGNFGVKNVPSRTATKVEPFSFEERDKPLLQIKQNYVKKQLEEERLARQFKAQTMPVFSSPVLPERKRLHRTSPRTPQISAYSNGIQNQLKFQQQLAEENAKKRDAAKFKARPARVTQQKPFKPILPQRVLSDVTELKLNTERRAVDRAQFDEKLKLIAADKEEKMAQLLAVSEAEASEEEARLRREAEFKATEFRPSTSLKIECSSKPLTQPLSPRLFVKERAKLSLHQTAI